MKSSLYLRTLVFGITDSLVSMVGLLAGIDIAGVSQDQLILTGIIYAFVEAFSMAVGNYLSEASAEEYESHRPAQGTGALAAAILMFVVYVVSSFIPLGPYFLYAGANALTISITVSVLVLFVLGVVSAAFAKLPLVGRGVRMAILGGAAILIGAVVGLFFKA